jgi:hypothetical protein
VFDVRTGRPAENRGGNHVSAEGPRRSCDVESLADGNRHRIVRTVDVTGYHGIDQQGAIERRARRNADDDRDPL